MGGKSEMNYSKRRIKFPVLYSFMVAILFLGASPLYAQTQMIKVSTDPWEPWVVGNEGEAPSGGIAIEITRELFKRLNLDIEITIYPYQRCLHQMKTGERDLLLMAKKTEEREKYMLFSDVVATDPQLIYYSTERMAGFEWEAWEDLTEYTVGIVQGFNYGEFATAAEKHQIATELVENDTQNTRKLLAGRVDLIILSQSTANYYFEQNPEHRGKFKAASKPVAEDEFHFALSKKGKGSPHLPGINTTLQEMKADGTLSKLLGFSE